MTNKPDDWEIGDDDRLAAHNALDRWLEECQRSAPDIWRSGRGGYIGRIKLCAFIGDDGVTLRIERSIAEDL